MPVESFLTRELNIRFIDAREIANEAKIKLGIHGYPSKQQEKAIQEEACKIFNCRPQQEQRVLRRLSSDLSLSKISKGSLSTLKALDLDISDEFSLDGSTTVFPDRF